MFRRKENLKLGNQIRDKVRESGFNPFMGPIHSASGIGPTASLTVLGAGAVHPRVCPRREGEMPIKAG